MYLKLSKLHQVDTGFCILWITLNIPSLKNVNMRPKFADFSNIRKSRVILFTYEMQSSRRFNKGRNSTLLILMFEE